MEEAYKSALSELKKKSHFGGPDYEVGLVSACVLMPAELKKSCELCEDVHLVLSIRRDQTA